MHTYKVGPTSKEITTIEAKLESRPYELSVLTASGLTEAQGLGKEVFNKASVA